MPFNLGPFEMIMFFLLILLLFGAKRLPEVGAGLGKGIREFKRSMNDIKGEINREDDAAQIRPPVRTQVTSGTEETTRTDA